MAAVLVPPVRQVPQVSPRRYRFTNDDFIEMSKAGLFADQRVILIDGEFIHTPPPIPPHDTALSLTDYALREMFRVGHYVRVQTGFPTDLESNPMPDLAVVTGSPRDYAAAHPRVAILIVEVADTSLTMDTKTKPFLYAAAGVPEYWVIDVNTPELIVFRDPTPDAAAPYGFRYADRKVLAPADSVTPLAAPTATVRVADLLP